MADFHVSLADPTEPDSSEESDSERKNDRLLVKPSPEISRIASVLRTASECDWNARYLILIRGLPGSGKTTLAKFLVSHVPDHVIVSEAGYEQEQHAQQQHTALPIWRSRLIEEARAACKQKAWAAMNSKVLAVIVDNENLQSEDMEPYVIEAVKRDYTIHMLEPNTPWRYKPAKLIKFTQRPITLIEIRQMHALFDRTITSDDLIREAKKKLRPFDSTSLVPLTTRGAPSSTVTQSDPVENERSCTADTVVPGSVTAAEEVEVGIEQAEEEEEEWDTANEKFPRRSTEPRDSSAEEREIPNSNTDKVTEAVPATEVVIDCLPSTSYTELDPVDHLASVFPHISRSQIREFLDLAAGDHVWASELILEGLQVGLDADYDAAGSVRHQTAPIDTAQMPLSDTGKFSESSSSHAVDVLQMQPEPSTSLDVCQVPLATDSSTIAPVNSRSFSITRQFVQDAQELYGFALGIPPVDLSTAAVPDFLFSEWCPEPELVRGILQSFLRFLGVAQPHSANGFRSKPNPVGGSIRQNWNNARKQRSMNYQNNYNYVTETASFTDIMADDEVIHRSIQDFRSSLDTAVVRRIMDRLMKKFPGVQRATVEETFVRMDFSESDTENSLRLLFSSSEPSRAEHSTADNVDAIGSFDARSTRKCLNREQPTEPGLSLQEIQDEEEALRRSVEDQRSKLKSLSSQLSLCRLKSQFPDIQLIELEHLLIRFDLNEAEIVKHLIDRGFSCRPVAPLIPANEDASPTRAVRLTQSSDELDVLNAKLSVVRQRICHIRQRMYKKTEKGVGSYYSSELGRLYREQRDLSFMRAQCMIDLRSVDYESELLANGETASAAASKAFAYVDLHGLDKSCALTVLKQRIQLLESLLQQVAPSSASSRSLVVITGRGGRNAESDLVHTSPILRPAVMNYLSANQYPFCEKYSTGSGYFVITVPNRK